MTDHEMLLLRAAVEATEGNIDLWRIQEGYGVGGGLPWPTLAEALTDRLVFLGADVPEWPSEERVAGLREHNAPHALTLPEYLALRGGS